VGRGDEQLLAQLAGRAAAKGLSLAGGRDRCFLVVGAPRLKGTGLPKA
jgi:hypothetical protein